MYDFCINQYIPTMLDATRHIELTQTEIDTYQGMFISTVGKLLYGAVWQEEIIISLNYRPVRPVSESRFQKTFSVHFFQPRLPMSVLRHPPTLLKSTKKPARPANRNVKMSCVSCNIVSAVKSVLPNCAPSATSLCHCTAYEGRKPPIMIAITRGFATIAP